MGRRNGVQPWCLSEGARILEGGAASSRVQARGTASLPSGTFRVGNLLENKNHLLFSPRKEGYMMGLLMFGMVTWFDYLLNIL